MVSYVGFQTRYLIPPLYWKLALVARLFDAESLFVLRQRIEWAPDGAQCLEWLGVKEGLSKISVQTGTSHGGVVLPDGTVADVALDFDVLKTLKIVLDRLSGRHFQPLLEIPVKVVINLGVIRTLPLDIPHDQLVKVEHQILPRNLAIEVNARS